MNEINKQAQVEELAIELDENGMVVLHDEELLKLVSGASGGTGTGIGQNFACGWKMM